MKYIGMTLSTIFQFIAFVVVVSIIYFSHIIWHIGYKKDEIAPILERHRYADFDIDDGRQHGYNIALWFIFLISVLVIVLCD